MRTLLLIALFYSQTGISQEIEFYAGLNLNQTYLSGKSSSSLLLENRKNSILPGYRIGINIPFKVLEYGMKAGLSLIHYSGKFEYGKLGNYGPYPYGGFSSGNISGGTYHNQTISFDFYPINIQFDNKLEIAIGANLALRIHSKLDGNHREWSDSSTPAFPSSGGYYNTTPLDETIGSKTNAGVLLNILYAHELKNGWVLVPQLLTNIYFIEDYTDHSKWMSMIGFGLRKSLGSPEPE
jgi:hypothetical protein